MKCPRDKAPGADTPKGLKGPNQGHHTPVRSLEASCFPKPFRSIVAQVLEGDRRYFDRHPGATQYTRAYVPGECWPQVHPGPGLVTVFRLNDYQQARALTFADGARFS